MAQISRERQALAEWRQAISENIYRIDPDFQHSVAYYLAKKCPGIERELLEYGEKIVRDLEPLVIENNRDQNLPRLDAWDGIGMRIDRIVHHPTYEAAGNILYSSRILERFSKPGHMLEALVFMFLASQAGEAGHNCPVACSAGMIRVLQKVADFPKRRFYIQKLCDPSYSENYTGAQFLTEVQGGSDVGQNQVRAYQEKGEWRIEGEKWFCSNADAELFFLTARFDSELSGTKGLGLFLVPAALDTGEPNHFRLRRLKEKIGTRSMASAEIDFEGAVAIPMGEPSEGFKMVMENVLHISRIFNTFCVLGMARRGFHIAYAYAEKRVAFGHPIIQYPLVKENLARIKAENAALLASICATTEMQDTYDLSGGEEKKLLLRLLVNLNKYLSALWSVEHIHHALDTLAGNGAIESFSTVPRLLRDSIVCENWEGTHNILRMQVLRDIERYQVDALFLNYMKEMLSSISDKRADILKNGLDKLERELSQFKTASPEIQSLQIRTVLDHMAILFCAAHLLTEALDQMEKGNRSKLHSFDYFVSLHVQQAEDIVQTLQQINRCVER